MRTAVIVDAVRTPIGRAHDDKGWFRQTRSDDLAVACVRRLLERTRIPPDIVDDVLFGATQQTGQQGTNVARLIGLMAGLPHRVAGVTINRLCGSSLQALHQAVHAIQSGAEDVQIVGGLEHMGRLPWGDGSELNPRLFHSIARGSLHMGLTAELLARRYRISREQQDRFAWQSHQRAARAHSAGEFSSELISVTGRDERGAPLLVDRDQCVRPDTTLAALAALEPVFLPKLGTVTAGNSSPRNDGAAALIVMSEARARELHLRPLARVRATAVIGVEPSLMGIGPVAATELALRRAGLSLRDIDLIELNEAFAAQVLACLQLLGLDESRVNVRGGALALGHPLGASGARIVATLVHLMRDREVRFGLATMCIGLGQGIATVLERVE